MRFFCLKALGWAQGVSFLVLSYLRLLLARYLQASLLMCTHWTGLDWTGPLVSIDTKYIQRWCRGCFPQPPAWIAWSPTFEIRVPNACWYPSYRSPACSLETRNNRRSHSRGYKCIGSRYVCARG